MAQQQPSGALNSVLGDRGRLGSGLQPQLAVGANAPGNQLQVHIMQASRHADCRLIITQIQAISTQIYPMRSAPLALSQLPVRVLLGGVSACLPAVSVRHPSVWGASSAADNPWCADS